MTVTVDKTRCIACGLCACAAPEVFRLAGTASTVIAQPEGKAPRVRDAANACPVNAIRVSVTTPGWRLAVHPLGMNCGVIENERNP